jgi:hypothetical protein
MYIVSIMERGATSGGERSLKASAKASVPYARRAAEKSTDYKRDVRTHRNKGGCWVHQRHDFRMTIAQWE